MKLTQEIIDQIQEAMLHTNMKGEINWKDGDEFIVIKNESKNPVVSAAPHPLYDYEKNVFTEDGREQYMKEQWIRQKKDIAKE